MRTLRFLETSTSGYPLTRRHISQEQSPGFKFSTEGMEMTEIDYLKSTISLKRLNMFSEVMRLFKRDNKESNDFFILKTLVF
jgi:hypothetical protein